MKAPFSDLARKLLESDDVTAQKFRAAVAKAVKGEPAYVTYQGQTYRVVSVPIRS